MSRQNMDPKVLLLRAGIAEKTNLARSEELYRKCVDIGEYPWDEMAKASLLRMKVPYGSLPFSDLFDIEIVSRAYLHPGGMFTGSGLKTTTCCKRKCHFCNTEEKTIIWYVEYDKYMVDCYLCKRKFYLKDFSLAEESYKHD